MEAAQNLKKTLESLGKKILRELSSHFTEQEEKQTLRKPDNSLQMESLQKDLMTEPQDTTTVTSSTDTSEKTTTETQIESESVSQVRDWAIGKIELLHEADRHRNARALAAEFDEWINIPEGKEEMEYMYLEDDGWTDQEIDVREPNT